MSEIGSLVVTLEANMAKYASDMGTASSIAKQRMGEINSAVSTVKSALGALGFAMGVNEFASLIKGSIDASERLANLSASTNLSVETLAGLNLLAKESGTDMDSLAKGINRMSVEMGKTPEKFKALGITATDSAAAFAQFSDIFKQLPDINQRNALAQAVFSKSWAELAPILAMGSAQIGEVIAKGTQLSGQTTEGAKAAREFNDKWTELTGTGGVMTRIMEGILPSISGIADEMLAVQESSLGASNTFEQIGASIGDGLVAVRDFTGVLYDHRQVVEAMAGVYLSWKIGTFISSMSQSAVATYTAMAATMAAKDAVVQKAAADAAATASTAALTAARVIELQVAVLAAEGETALAITTNGLVPAQARAAAAAAAHAASQSALAVAEAEASIATGALNTALSFMGGPIGILITLIGAAATAWTLFGQHGKSAVQGINDEVAKGIAIADRYNKEMKFGTGDAGQLTSSLDAVNQRISLLSQSKGQGAAEQLRLARSEAEKLESALMQAGKAASSVAPPSGLTDSQKSAAAAAAVFLATSQGKDDPARIRLQAQIKVSDSEIVQIKANQTYVEKLLQDSYAQQYMDANTYYADRRAVIQSALDDEVAQYAKGSADVAIYLASSKDKDKVERAAAANLLIGEKLTKAQNEAGRELAATVTEQNKIYREFELTTNAVAHAQQLANDQSAFELDMIGRTTSEVAQLTAARLIQLAVDERIYQARLKNIPTGLSDKAALDAQAAADKAIADAKAKHDQNLSYNFNLGTTDVSHTSKLADDAARFSLELMGKTTLAVAQQNAARQIQLALDARLYELEKLREKLSPEDLAKAVLDAEIQKTAASALVTVEYEKQRTAQFGISEAFRKYSEEAGNTAAHMEALFTKSFKGMEDALVSFVRTGKLDFASLADSIVADLVRIAIQQSITGPLAAAFSSGGVATFFASIFGFADGGEPPMGQASLVGENGPELFVPHSSGTIIPNSALGGGGTVVNVIESPGNGGQVNRRSSGGVDYVDVFVEKVKNSLAGDISRGVGAVPNAMASTYGLNRVAGVY